MTQAAELYDYADAVDCRDLGELQTQPADLKAVWRYGQ